MPKMKAKLTDGRDVIVNFENKGDVVPAFDENGKPYRAYTSMIEIFDLDGKRLDFTFCQVDKKFADQYPGGATVLRETEDSQAMQSMGIVLDSLAAA